MKKDNEIKNRCDTRAIKDRPLKSLNGRESSILALLAQIIISRNVSKLEEEKTLLVLKNEESLDSYRIGCLILGIEIDNPDDDEIAVANGFKKWAKILVKINPENEIIKIKQCDICITTTKR